MKGCSCSWVLVKECEIKAGFSKQQDGEFQLSGRKLKKKKKWQNQRERHFLSTGSRGHWHFLIQELVLWWYTAGGQEESLPSHTVFLPLFPKKTKLSHFMSGQERLFPTVSVSPTPETFNPLASFNQIGKCLENLKTWSYPRVSNWVLNIQMCRHFYQGH